MSFEMKGKAKGHIDTKRFYVPGVVLVSLCPECGQPGKKDLGEDYLSYPGVGEPMEVGFVHPLDEDWNDLHEWTESVIMHITFSSEPGTTPKMYEV